MRLVTCYPKPFKKKSLYICQAFAEGVVAVNGPGAAQVSEPERGTQAGAAFFYGVTPEIEPILDDVVARRLDYLYADNAYYFGRGQYFRVTLNGMQHDGSGQHESQKWERFRTPIKPWRKRGSEILITTQSDAWHRKFCGMSQARWADSVAQEIRQHTDRPIRVCHKPVSLRRDQCHDDGFETYLRSAWALVTLSSSTAIKAVIDGIPVFPLSPCAASMMGTPDLSRIEAPVYPGGRHQWISNLCANQWTIDEMRDGTCWKALRGQT